MACIRPHLPLPLHADPNPNRNPRAPLGFLTPSAHRPTLPPFKGSAAASVLCLSQNPNSSSAPLPDEEPGRRRPWDSLIQDVVRSAVKRWDDYMSSYWNTPAEDNPSTVVVADGDHVEEIKEEDEEEVGVKEQIDWDWERWKRHFAEVEEEEAIVAVLKSQLIDAVAREDYEDAAKIKLAIATASKKDIVGTTISDLNRAIEDERYNDAIFFRDYAGAGLVGWWAGLPEVDAADPYGRIIRITAEHGRYVARIYNSRQLATGRAGLPLFEIFFTENDGEYKKQAVYLKWNSVHSGDVPKKSAKKSVASSQNPSDSTAEGQNSKFTEEIKTIEESEDDSDASDGLAGFQNILRDMIPGVKVKVFKVVSPGKVDRDLIAKVIDQIADEEDEGDDEEVESTEAEDVSTESEIEEIEMDAGDATNNTILDPSESPVKFVIGTLMQKMSADVSPKEKIRVPASIERRDRLSFLFSIDDGDGKHVTDGKEHALKNKVAARAAQPSVDLVMSDLAKVFLSKKKIPMKVLKDVGKLISSTINQNNDHQYLSGTTLFNRIEIPSASDPLGGLYVGAHGMHTSEVLYLKRKFGQWKVEDSTQEHKDLEFYEYVEAVKLSGGLSVPAGQAVFRAKVGKRYQLPHKGIIPEEFGVVARYKGQGRVPHPGVQKSRWVDGELVILDGKHVRSGPVIGFVYWAPEYHFLVFFNRLRLPE